MKPNRSEAGTTLIELLMTIAIMAIAFVGVVGGIGTAIIGADVQRRHTTSDVVLTTAAERILATSVGYVPCAATYPPPMPNPSGFVVVVDTVRFWDLSAKAFVASHPRCTASPPDTPADDGLQLIKLKITAQGSGSRPAQAEFLEVVKRQVGP